MEDDFKFFKMVFVVIFIVEFLYSSLKKYRFFLSRICSRVLEFKKGKYCFFNRS